MPDDVAQIRRELAELRKSTADQLAEQRKRMHELRNGLHVQILALEEKIQSLTSAPKRKGKK